MIGRALLAYSATVIIAIGLMATSCRDDGNESPELNTPAPYDSLCLASDGTPVAAGRRFDGLTWRVMGPKDNAPFDRMGVCREEWFEGAPRLRSTFVVRDAEEAPLELVQGIDRYLAEIDSEPERVQVNGLDVMVRPFALHTVGVFLTGEDSAAGPIWGQVTARSRDTLIEFVAALEFTDSP